MKELSIEQKVQRYDEALKRAKKLYEQGTITESLSYVFPELKEREDYRKPNGGIVLEDFHGGDGFYKVNLAYLSKEQVEEIENIVNKWNAEPEESEDEKIRKWIKKELENKYVEDGIVNNVLADKAFAWLEKQGEPTDINPSEFDLRLNKLIKQFETLPKEELASSLSFYLNVVQNDGTYKADEKKGEQKPTDTCDSLIIKSKEFPASEKRDFGYFNEPTDKVEQKFHEGDWVVVSTAKGDRVVQIASVEYSKDGYPSYITTEGRWFGNVTKARLLTDKDAEIVILPESRVIKSKSPWSEEDEQIILSIEQVMNCASLLNIVPEKVDKIRTWLKSLEQRIEWKPSDEQMKALHDLNLTGNISYAEQGQVLIELYNDLKKL